jgi:hypothetical protein
LNKSYASDSRVLLQPLKKRNSLPYRHHFSCETGYEGISIALKTSPPSIKNSPHPQSAPSASFYPFKSEGGQGPPKKDIEIQRNKKTPFGQEVSVI